MSEQEIKVGQSVTYTIADRVLTLKPMSLGKMKRATLIFSDKNQDNLEMIGKYLQAILDNGQNGDVSLDWIQENVTIPEAESMIDASRKINGLGDFFQKGQAPASPAKATVEERPINEVTPILSE